MMAAVFSGTSMPKMEITHFQKDRKIGHDKSNAAFFQAQGFLWQKIGRALQRAAVHNGKGNESHEKP
jgi:hypothetical protein